MTVPPASHIEVADARQHSQTYWNHAKTVILVLALSSIYFCQLTLLVGGGLLSRDIATVTGSGASLTTWPTAVLGIIVAALSPPVAQIADYIGSVIVSRSTSFGMAIAGFTIGGLSCAAQPLLHAVVSEVMPRKYRSWAQASVNLSVCCGAIYGLLAGGALTLHNPAGFRTYFYILTGIYAACTVATVLLYNPPPREEQVASFRTKVHQLDWVGYALVGSGVILLCIGLSWAKNPYPWRNSHVLGPFLIGILILTVLIVYEWKFKKDGLFHHQLFRHRNFPITLGCIYIEGHGAFAANYFVPFQLSTMYPSMGSFNVGLCYAVSYFSFIIFAVVAGFFVWKGKTVRIPIMAGFLAFLIFFILTATSTTSSPEANFWGYMVFLGAGLGLLLTTLVVAAQFSTPPELIAITSGLLLAVRSLGASTGLVIYQAVFSASLSKHLVPEIAAATVPLGLPEASLAPLIGALKSGNMDSLTTIPGITPEITAAASIALRQAYNLAFRYVWVTAAAFSFPAFISAAFLREPKDEFTAAIDAPLDVKVDSDTDVEAETRK